MATQVYSNEADLSSSQKFMSPSQRQQEMARHSCSLAQASLPEASRGGDGNHQPSSSYGPPPLQSEFCSIMSELCGVWLNTARACTEPTQLLLTNEKVVVKIA